MKVLTMPRTQVYYLQIWSRMTGIPPFLTWLRGILKPIPKAQKWDGQAPLLFFLLQETLWVDFFHYLNPFMESSQAQKLSSWNTVSRASLTLLPCCLMKSLRSWRFVIISQLRKVQIHSCSFRFSLLMLLLGSFWNTFNWLKLYCWHICLFLTHVCDNSCCQALCQVAQRWIIKGPCCLRAHQTN